MKMPRSANRGTGQIFCTLQDFNLFDYQNTEVVTFYRQSHGVVFNRHSLAGFCIDNVSASGRNIDDNIFSGA